MSTQNFKAYLLGVFILVLLQLGVMYFDQSLRDLMAVSKYPFNTFDSLTSVLGSIGFSTISGMVLLFLIWPRKQSMMKSNGFQGKAIFLSAIPLLMIGLKLGFLVWGVNPISFLGNNFFIRFGIWDWLLFSQVPTLWMGMVIGWTVNHVISNEVSSSIGNP